MKSLTISGLALSLFFLGSFQVPAKGFNLDTFTEANTSAFGDTQLVVLDSLFFPDTPTDIDTGLGSSVFGGQRELRINNNSGNSQSLFSINLNGSQQAQLDAGTGTSTTAEIIWDGNDLSNTPTDITIDGVTEQKSIQLIVIEVGIGPGDGDLELNFEFRDTSDNVATITQSLTVGIASPESLFFAYQDRVESTSDAGGDIDLTQVDYIRFYTSDENNGDDFAFDILQTSRFVPFEFSPALGIMIGGGFLGFSILRKRMTK